MAKRLSDQQLKFVEAYAQKRNIREAAIAAGYTPKSAQSVGSRLLKKDHVRAAIREVDRETSERLVLTNEWIIERLMIEAVGETEAPTPEDAEGARKQESRIIGGASARVSALKILADIQEMRTVNHKHEGDINVNHNTTGAQEALLERLTAVKATKSPPAAHVH